MKLSNLAPLAAGILMSTLAGCSDNYLRHIEGGGDNEQNTIPSAEANAPADAPPNFPGSSLFEDTCFGLLGPDLAPIDTETGDYYQPVLDWMDRTSTKLGIGLLQRLSHYEPERIGAGVVMEYEEAGTDPTIDEAMEHMRELLVERGVTVSWHSGPMESSLGIALGDRRNDIDVAVESLNETLASNRINPWMISDMICWFRKDIYKAGVGVGKIDPADWDVIPWMMYPSTFFDKARFNHYADFPISDFIFVPADANHCLPTEEGPSDYPEDWFWYPEGTTCFDHDSEVDLDSGTLLGQTTDNWFDQLESGTKLVIDALSDGQENGRVYFEGPWFAQ